LRKGARKGKSDGRAKREGNGMGGKFEEGKGKRGEGKGRQRERRGVKRRRERAASL